MDLNELHCSSQGLFFHGLVLSEVAVTSLEVALPVADLMTLSKEEVDLDTWGARVVRNKEEPWSVSLSSG